MNLPSARPAGLRLAVPALALVAVTAVAGCGGQSDDDSATPGTGSKGSTAQGKAGASEPLPLTAYIQNSDDDARTIQRATNLLMVSCMKRYGFDYRAQPEVVEAKPARDSEYRQLPAARAASYGYRSPAAADAAAQETGDDGKTGSAAEEAVRIGTGAATVGGKAVPDGGCKGEVSRTMAKGLPELPVPSPVDEAANAAAQKAQADASLTAAVGKWSACMKEQGFVFAQPQDPLAQFSGKSGRDSGGSPDGGDRVAATATDEEKKVAVADSACNKKSSLEQTWYTVTKPLQQAEIDRRAEEFKLVEEWNQGYVKNAQKALAKN
ncbi:hypothetical protein ACWD7C_07725 [Streptomyces sp. NPDC005134]|uniref:hypothetical protein n=1 Tax=unclassified Streptomyces TaxID=2593676 RepID=UPI00339DB321